MAFQKAEAAEGHIDHVCVWFHGVCTMWTRICASACVRDPLCRGQARRRYPRHVLRAGLQHITDSQTTGGPWVLTHGMEGQY